MSSMRYWVWLSSVTSANPRSRAALAEHYEDAENAFLAPPGEFQTIPGVSAADAAPTARSARGGIPMARRPSPTARKCPT